MKATARSSSTCAASSPKTHCATASRWRWGIERGKVLLPPSPLEGEGGCSWLPYETPAGAVLVRIGARDRALVADRDRHGALRIGHVDPRQRAVRVADETARVLVGVDVAARDHALGIDPGGHGGERAADVE